MYRTHGSRESDTTYSKDSIAHLEKSRVNKYNRDHQFDILQKSTRWIKIQREKKLEKTQQRTDLPSPAGVAPQVGVDPDLVPPLDQRSGLRTQAMTSKLDMLVQE